MKDLIAELESLASEIETAFGELSVEQFNWKPAADVWSVGQCLEHLVLANQKEIKTIEKGVNGDHTKSLWERIPVLPGFVGRLVIKAVDPANLKKNTAPKAFEPSQSKVSKRVIADYKIASKQICSLAEACKDKDTGTMIITSPVAQFFTYSLQDAFRIIAYHDRRHFNQAKRVMESDGFPK